MDLDQVEAHNEAGLSVPVEKTSSEIAETVSVDDPSFSSLSYTARIGKEWVYPNVGKDMGRRFGFLNSKFGIMSGANLFLIPENHTDLKDVRVTFKNLPDDFELVTTFDTLKRMNGVYSVDITRSSDLLAESLHSALVAVGRFRSRSEQMNGTLVTAYFEDSLEGDSDNLFRTILDKHQYLGARLGDLQSRYTYIFVPQTSDDKKIEIDASALGQSQSVLHWTRSLWAKINYNLAEAYTRFRPTGFLYKPTDLWFSEGVAGYISLLMLERQGLADLRSEIGKSFDRYFIDPRVTFVDLKAIENRSNPFPQRDKALLLTYFLDHELQTNGKSIFALLNEIQHNGRVVDLKRNIKAVADNPLHELLDRYLNEPGRMILPSELQLAFPELAPLAKDQIEETAVDELSSPLKIAAGDTCRIVFSGGTHSYLENCGCKRSQNGGVSRRMTAIEALRGGAGSSLLVDVGDFFPEEKQSPRLDPLVTKELETHLAAMKKMGYDAAAIGFAELRYSYEFFEDRTRGSELPVVNCNVRSAADHPIAAPYLVKRVGQTPVVIIGVWENKMPDEYVSFYEDAIYGLSINDPVEAVAQTASQFNSDQNLIIVLGNVSPQTARRIVDRSPNIGAVITSTRGAIDYKSIPEQGDGNISLRLYKEDKTGLYRDTLILYANLDTYGISAADLELDRNGKVRSARIKRIILSEKVREDATIRALLDNYYSSIESDPSLKAAPLFRWDKSLENNTYVGFQTCAQCHEGEYDHWRGTKHFAAFKTLIVSRRQLYPKCAVCHVTGYGYTPGFTTTKDEKRFGAVQCEICHGPGKRHSLAPAENNIRKTPPQQVCTECHTREHSNNFVFSERIEKVRHSPQNGARSAE